MIIMISALRREGKLIDMKQIRVLAIIMKEGKIIGMRITDVDRKEIADAYIAEISPYINMGKCINMEFEGRKLVSTECSMSRIPIIEDGKGLKQGCSIFIIGTTYSANKRMFDIVTVDGQYRRFSENELVTYAFMQSDKNNVFVNAKINGRKLVPIIGKFKEY